MSSIASTSDPPSRERKEGLGDLDMSGPAYLYAFYRYVEMDKWSDDCVQRIKELSEDDSLGSELCRVFNRIILYYNSMAESIKESDKRQTEEYRSRLAFDYDTAEENSSIMSPTSPGGMRPSSSPMIEEEEESEQMNGESTERSVESSHSMEDNEDEGELIESGDEQQSISPLDESTVVESTVVQTGRERAMDNNGRTTDEERMHREPSMFVLRQVRPHPSFIPPVRHCKVEIRGEEREEAATPTETSAESTSHNELRDTTTSDASTSKETPSLRVKQEVPENPFVSPSRGPPTSVTPPALVIKTESQTPTSANSHHNYNVTSSTEVTKKKKKWTPIDATDDTTASTSSLFHPSYHSLPSSSTADQATTSFSDAPRGIDRATQKILAAKLEDQIIHINSIKQIAASQLPPLALGHLSAPLPSVGCNGIPLSLEIFDSECRIISNEVRALEIQFDALLIPPNEYYRVSNREVGTAIDKIWATVKKKVEEAENQSKMTTDSMHKGDKNVQGAPLRRKISKISGKAKEFGTKSADKRTHPDLILPADNSGPQKKRRLNRKSLEEGREERRKERREERERERRESDDEQPSTSRGRIHDDMDMRRGVSRWCAFCKKKSHNSVDCLVYKTYNARSRRLNELKLCFHCLDTYNPPSCNRKEHMLPCPHCNRHTSHVSLCKFLNMTFDSPRSPDRRNRRND